jgi:hypothetical protein
MLAMNGGYICPGGFLHLVAAQRGNNQSSYPPAVLAHGGFLLFGFGMFVETPAEKFCQSWGLSAHGPPRPGSSHLSTWANNCLASWQAFLEGKSPQGSQSHLALSPIFGAVRANKYLAARWPDPNPKARLLTTPENPIHLDRWQAVNPPFC